MDVPARNLPPTFINRIALSVNPVFTRIAVGESMAPDDPVVYHAAFVIPTVDLPALRDTLDKLLKAMQESVTAGFNEGMTKQ